MNAAPDANGAASLPARRLAQALRGDLDWIAEEGWEPDAVAARAIEQGVDLLLWRTQHDALPEPLRARLGARVTAEVARAAVRDRELADVVAALTQGHVDAVVFKGAALAHTCYATPWLRPRLDTDILVGRQSFDRAAAVLEAAGYGRSPLVSTGDLVSHQVAFERTDRIGASHLLDLHWRVLNPQMLSRIADADTLLDDAASVTLHGVRLRVPAPVWSLVLACAHRLAHHQQEERLIWVHDIHALASRFQGEDWESLLRIARERQVSAICGDGLGLAAGLLGTKVPAEAARVLAERGVAEPSRQYVEGRVRRLDVLRDDLRHLSWPDRLHLLKEHAFPPAAFMRSRYRIESGLLLPILYVHRLVTGARGWIRR